MTATGLQLGKPSIVEAVVDLDCILPPTQRLEDLQSAAEQAFGDAYPEFSVQIWRDHSFEATPHPPSTIAVEQRVEALQFASPDKREVVQMRSQGYSFNRLAPYPGLDAYMDAMERTWKLYCAIACPVEVKVIRLRYINRIPLPMTEGRVNLETYLNVAPPLPLEKDLTFTGFLEQHTAVEVATGYQVKLILASEAPIGQVFPVIYDITVAAGERHDPKDWAWILAKIQALRALKNRIFESSLTHVCLNQFQQP